jgi:hypothetical protein
LKALAPQVHRISPYQRLACVRATLLILAVATTTPQPRARPFYPPTLGSAHAPLAAFGTSPPLQAPWARGLRGAPRVAAMRLLRALGPSHCSTWRGRKRPRLQDVGRGSRIVAGSPADQDDQPQPQDRATAVACAALDVLAALIATRAPLGGRLPRLPLETRRPWGGLLRGRRWWAALGAPGLQPLWPRALVSPRRTGGIDGALGQPSVGEHGPWAPWAVEGHEGVEDGAQGHRARAPAGLRWGQKRLHERPWIIGESSQGWLASGSRPGQGLQKNRIISLPTLC